MNLIEEQCLAREVARIDELLSGIDLVLDGDKRLPAPAAKSRDQSRLGWTVRRPTEDGLAEVGIGGRKQACFRVSGK